MAKRAGFTVEFKAPFTQRQVDGVQRDPRLVSGHMLHYDKYGDLKGVSVFLEGPMDKILAARKRISALRSKNVVRVSAVKAK